MPIAIGRWHAEYWSRRAAKYRDMQMSQDILVMHQPALRRVAVVEYGREHGQREVHYLPVRDKALGCSDAGSLRKEVYKYLFSQQKITRLPRIKRIWQVGWHQPYGSHDRVGWCDIAVWDHLEMAQGHLEALNYHYAWWLMTRDTPAAGL